VTPRSLTTSTSSLPISSSAVVVGGGSLGTSTAYHLQKLGIQTTLLERSSLTAGTTWHSAGMLWNLRPSDTDVQINAYTRTLLQSLCPSAFTKNGGLIVATTTQRFQEYQRLHETGKYFGIPSDLIDPATINDIHPLLNTSDLVGALYSPFDGTIDPTTATNAYAAAATSLGAHIITDTTVAHVNTTPSSNPLSPDSNTIQSITTSCGHTIDTPVVVNACGAWAGALHAMVSLNERAAESNWLASNEIRACCCPSAL